MDNNNQNAAQPQVMSNQTGMQGSAPVNPPASPTPNLTVVPKANDPVKTTEPQTQTAAPDLKIVPKENTPQQPTAPATSGVQKRILVVDDEPDAKDLFAELLRTKPEYIVDTAMDGHECLDMCSKNRYDLVLLDIVMPNLDGVDTLSQIKLDPAKYGNPIVIMLTNIGGDIAIQEALKLGAVGYKLKIDTEPNELLDTVAKAFESQVNNSASVQTPPQQEAKAA